MKSKIINAIIEIEGGYVNDPSDSGGETKYGITKKVARENGYTGLMFELPRELAFKIYVDKYWHSIQADRLFILSSLITEEMVDTSINMGFHRAGVFLQRALNALNNREKLYSDIIVDGIIGIGTLNALHSYLLARDDDITITKMLNCMQGAFYVDLAERREKDEKFIYGWFKNRVKL